MVAQQLKKLSKRSKRKIGIRDIIYANDFLVSLLLIIFTRQLHKVMKYVYHQINDLRNHKTEVITALILNFAIVLLHLFEGTNRICEMMEFIKPLLIQSNSTMIEIRVIAVMPSLVQTYYLWS